MGCGCNKKRRSQATNLNINRSNRVQQISVQNLPNNVSAEQARAIGFQSNTEPRTSDRMDADRRRIEKLRRDAVRRSLNK